MINIVGLIIFIAGFFAPYLSEGRLSSIILFWLGGFMILNKGLFIRREARWANWARMGILINITVVVVMFVVARLIGYGTTTKFEYWLSMILYWLSAPFTAIGQQIFPFPETRLSDGSVRIQISYFRIVITSFLTVVTYASISVAVGFLWQKMKRNKIDS
jgi:hypothetical protein